MTDRTINRVSNRTTNSMDELHLRNRLDDLGILSDWLSDRGAQRGISTQGVFRLQLVLEEIVMNTIQNAYSDTDEHSIAVQLDYQDNTIHVSVIDDGAAFNPLEYPEIVLPTSLETAEIGGLGLHLVRHYTNTCRYQRQNHQNILTMTICDRPLSN